jgi:FkbM family methyltransferase
LNNLRLQLGLLRSLLIYRSMPGRRRQLAGFYRQFIQPGDLCFDIGAHVGNRLQAWLDLHARIVAVEPQPHLAALLRRWYGQNAQVALVEQAVGAKPGTGRIYISQRHPTVSSLSQDWIKAVQRTEPFASVRWDAVAEVRVTTLDALIAQFGRPAFCKIDVEGYELEALGGLSQPLPALSFEYIASAADLAIACIECLEQLGRFDYNWSPGEAQRLQSVSWLAPEVMMARLQALTAAEGSGDVYARLQVQGTTMDGPKGRGGTPSQSSSRYARRARPQASSAAICDASMSSTMPLTTSPASQSALARRHRSWRAGIEGKARVSSLKPAVL